MAELIASVLDILRLSWLAGKRRESSTSAQWCFFLNNDSWTCHESCWYFCCFSELMWNVKHVWTTSSSSCLPSVPRPHCCYNFYLWMKNCNGWFWSWHLLYVQKLFPMFPNPIHWAEFSRVQLLSMVHIAFQAAHFWSLYAFGFFKYIH